MSIRPPAQIAAIVEILGQDDAFDFLYDYGGAPIYLAGNPGARNPLVKRFGRERVIRLSEALGGPGNFYVPVAKSWMMRVLASRGLGRFEIARRMRVSHVSVRRAIGRQDHLQLSLFDADDR